MFYSWSSAHRSTKAWSFPFFRGTALPRGDREQVHSALAALCVPGTSSGTDSKAWHANIFLDSSGASLYFCQGFPCFAPHTLVTLASTKAAPLLQISKWLPRTTRSGALQSILHLVRRRVRNHPRSQRTARAKLVLPAPGACSPLPKHCMRAGGVRNAASACVCQRRGTHPVWMLQGKAICLLPALSPWPLHAVPGSAASSRATSWPNG